jgi:ribosomal protein S18 acetylase RimI-like enzyme
MGYLPDLYQDEEVLSWITDVVLKEKQVLVATIDEEVIAGFAAYADGFLDHLYVATFLQVRGIGSALLSAVKKANPGGLRLHVFQKNTRARSFYEQHGFRLVELRDGLGNEEREPDAVYEWQCQFADPPNVDRWA